jgi:hypothetical protein
MIEFILITIIQSTSGVPSVSALPIPFISQAECFAAGEALKSSIPSAVTYSCLQRTVTASEGKNLLATPPVEFPARLNGVWHANGTSGSIQFWDIRVAGEKVTGGFALWNPLCSKFDSFSGTLSGKTLTFEQEGAC